MTSSEQRVTTGRQVRCPFCGALCVLAETRGPRRVLRLLDAFDYWPHSGVGPAGGRRGQVPGASPQRVGAVRPIRSQPGRPTSR